MVDRALPERVPLPQLWVVRRLRIQQVVVAPIRAVKPPKQVVMARLHLALEGTSG